MIAGRIFFAIVGILVLFAFVHPFIWSKNYVVKITYCDNRPYKIDTIYSDSPPNNGNISTYKLAVPTYDNELNVCSVETINVLP